MFNELYNYDTCREPDIAAHKFIGTIKKDEKTARGGFQEPDKKITNFVEFERSQTFRQQLLSCDVIIYDLMSNDFDEVDYVIKTLKTSDLQEDKTLVLLSSVMTWVNTPPKFKDERPEGEEGAEGEAEEEPEEEEEPEDEEVKEEEKDDDEKGEVDENGEPIVIAKPIFFKETDYHLRVPHARF